MSTMTIVMEDIIVHGICDCDHKNDVFTLTT
jgi:hypothetical protein